MKKNTTSLRPVIHKLILFMTLALLILSSTAPVYADPDKKEDASGGWIEAVCTVVPEGFEGSVSVMVSEAESDEVYTIDCLKANNFVGRKKLPYGKYFVDRIYTSDTFYYEGFTDLFSFELTKEMSAAQKIEIEVIQNNVPDGVFEMRQEDPSEKDSSNESEATLEKGEAEKQEDPKEDPSSAADLEEEGSKVSENDDTKPQTEAEPDDSSTTKKALRNIGISLLATVGFVGIVALFVYLGRSYFYEEE